MPLADGCNTGLHRPIRACGRGARHREGEGEGEGEGEAGRVSGALVHAKRELPSPHRRCLQGPLSHSELPHVWDADIANCRKQNPHRLHGGSAGCVKVRSDKVRLWSAGAGSSPCVCSASVTFGIDLGHDYAATSFRTARTERLSGMRFPRSHLENDDLDREW
eukprot:1648457-Rhodomonas_salina.6